MTATESNNGGTALATREQRPRNQLASLLESRRDAMKAVLPRHLTPDRLIKVALVAVSKTPLLMECTPETVLQSVMTAAQLGLDCGGALGSAYLVPFKKNWKDDQGRWQSEYQCQLIIGYRGMIDLARRSGQISSIECRIVYENDEFSLDYGFETRFVHKPVLDRDAGKLRLVYAVAKLRDGGTQFELMTRAQIDGIRARSKSKDNGPWVTDYEEMARKTVVKRLFKYLPVSVEMAQAVDEDNKAEFGDIMGVSADAPRAIDGLNQRLKALPEQVNTVTGEVTDDDSATAPPSSSPPSEAEESMAETQQPAAPAELSTEESMDAVKAYARLESLAESLSVAPSKFESGIKKACASRGGFKKVSPAFRRDIFNAIRDGRFDWDKAQIGAAE